MHDLASFLLAGIALTGSPGPATLALAAAGAAFGPRRSLALLAGILAGVLLVMVVTASGVTALVLAQPGLGPAVAALAALYMLHLAWRIAAAPLPGEVAADRAPGFAAGLALGLGNPKAYAAMAALYSGFVVVRGAPAADAAAKTAILLALMVPVDIAWLLLGAALTRALRRPALGRAVNVAFAALLLASMAAAFAL